MNTLSYKTISANKETVNKEFLMGQITNCDLTEDIPHCNRKPHFKMSYLNRAGAPFIKYFRRYLKKQKANITLAL